MSVDQSVHRHLIIMAKAPVAGFAKTRLIPLLGAQGAADLQAQLTQRAYALALATTATTIEMCCTPSAAHEFFSQFERAQLTNQSMGDLGERMQQAFAAAVANQPAGVRVVMIGTDCPTLTAQTIDNAFAALSDCDAVFAPAEDGGYVLIGLITVHEVLFANMPWSTTGLMQATRVAAQRQHIRLQELASHYDIDVPADYLRWQRDYTAA